MSHTTVALPSFIRRMVRVGCLGLLMAVTDHPHAVAVDLGTAAPEITGQSWLNASPQRITDLKGKVVLVEFWTYGCYNCQNVEPYIKEWHKKYVSQGLVVIGVHSPEFRHERELNNVQQYVRDHAITYPVVTDNDFAIWHRYGNRAWPTVYLIDTQGKIRHVRIGEGGYLQTEQWIQSLLAEGSK
jgi:thiol-disulfide isomerase/thioredoxin